MPDIARAALTAALLLITPGPTFADDPPEASLPERDRKLHAADEAMAADRPADAVAALERAVEIERTLWGKRLDLESDAWSRLAWALFLTGKQQASEELAARVRADTATATGDRDHWRARDAARLTEDLRALADAEAALKTAWGEALARRAKAALLTAAGDHDAALAEAARAAEGAKGVWGEKHAESARADLEFARIALAAGKPSAVKPALERAAGVFAATVGERHPDYAAALFERGRFASAAGDHRDAVVAFKRAAEVFAVTHGPAKFGRIKSLQLLAHAEDAAGDPEAAIATGARIIQTLTEAGLADSEITLSTRELRAARLTRLGLTRSEPEKYREALAELEAVAAARRRGDPKSEMYAWALLQIGMNRRSLGELDSAHRAVDQGLALLNALPDPNPAMIDHGLTTRVQSHLDAADYAAAKEACRAAIAHRKAFWKPDDPATLRMIEMLATIHRSLNEPAETVALLREVLALRRRPGERQTPEYVDTLERYASAAELAGDFATTRQALAEAVRIVRTGTFDPKLAARVLTAQGAFRFDRREWFDAAATYLEAETVLREAGLSETTEYGDLLLALAEVADKSDKLEEAAGYFRKSLAIHREVAGADAQRFPAGEHYLSALLTTAVRHNAWERYDDAAGFLEEYLRIVRGRPQPGLGYSNALRLLGMVETNRGRLDEADKALDECLAVARARYGERHYEVASALGLKADVAHRRRDYPAAMALYREALAAVSNDPNDWIAEMPLLLTAGISAAASGDRATAVEFYTRAVELERRVLDEAMAGLSERQQLDFSRSARETLDSYLALTRGEDAGPAYARVLAWKGAVFARQRRLAALRGRPDLSETFRELERVSAEIASASLAGTPPPEAVLRPLVNERERLERALAADPAVAAELKPAAVTPVDVAAALPADAALIDLIEYDSPDWAGPFWSGRRLAAFVLRHGRPVVRVELGPAGSVRTALDAWAPWSSRVMTRARVEAAGQLRERLWEPLTGHLDGVKTVLVSPDGAAGMVPFAALPGSEPGTYLLQEMTVTAIPAAHAVPGLLADPPARPGGSLLLVGGVDFGEAPGDGGRRFRPLPGARAEADEVAQLWRRHVDGPAFDLRGESASEPAVRERLGGVRFAHLATHGYVGQAARAAADAGGLANPFLLTVGAYAPAAHSAVALAGANRAASGGGDGLLAAYELVGQDLGGIELVVLSACDSGVGRLEAGEGALGLRRALHVGGARTVVASLWPVGDESTRKLMGEFYRNLWERGLPKGEALRHAQLTLALAGSRGDPDDPDRGVVRPGTENSPGPADWAAFVLSGDWR